MATAPSPNDLTRQQLDELDALLQRMLSVPLAPVDTPMPVGTLPAPTPPTPTTPPTPPSWRIDPPVPAASVSSPHLVLPEPQSSVALKFEAPPAPPPPAPIAPPPTPAQKPPTKATLPPAPLPKPVPQTPVVSPPPPVPWQAAPPPAPVPIPPPSATKLTPAPSTAPLPIIFLPFVVLNVLFDGICGMFGPPGRLFRSTFFKYLYGLIGLGLLFYTAAHVAQVRQWLTLPITLPWPPRM